MSKNILKKIEEGVIEMDENNPKPLIYISSSDTNINKTNEGYCARC